MKFGIDAASGGTLAEMYPHLTGVKTSKQDTEGTISIRGLKALERVAEQTGQDLIVRFSGISGPWITIYDDYVE